MYKFNFLIPSIIIISTTLFACKEKPHTVDEINLDSVSTEQNKEIEKISTVQDSSAELERLLTAFESEKPVTFNKEAVKALDLEFAKIEGFPKQLVPYKMDSVKLMTFYKKNEKEGAGQYFYLVASKENQTKKIGLLKGLDNFFTETGTCSFLDSLSISGPKGDQGKFAGPFIEFVSSDPTNMQIKYDFVFKWNVGRPALFKDLSIYP